jgi:putative RNA 2'-phosphotransferase
MNKRFVKLSKLLSFILRHASEDFHLPLDEYGYAPVDDIVNIIRDRYRDFDRDELRAVVEADSKGRYELVGDKIRACYGHSVAVSSRAKAVKPPEILYHGTSGRSLPLILRDGLMPMTRQYVHLSVTPEEAVKVGRRHSSNVILLRIHARDAHESGIEFRAEASVYLVRRLPPEFIEVIESEI